MIHVLFVCMGNICRSPAAEGVFRHKVRAAGLETEIHIDSAGTHGYHEGEPPDPRSIDAAAERGIDISSQRSRPVRTSDFSDFDMIIAMDDDNIAALESKCPRRDRNKIHRLLDFAVKTALREVPDPYYGGARGFEKMMDLLDDGLEGLLAAVRERLKGPSPR